MAGLFSITECPAIMFLCDVAATQHKLHPWNRDPVTWIRVALGAYKSLKTVRKGQLQRNATVNPVQKPDIPPSQRGPSPSLNFKVSCDVESTGWL